MRLNNYPIITDRRLKVGVVGCGRISKNHFGSILQYPDELELAVVCDIDGDAVKQAAADMLNTFIDETFAITSFGHMGYECEYMA
ncbi:Gfo/Idh/MocA family oxidoreductase, partial [Planktomarina temperata]|nr:Gfo/Idh/MocA family oxidoreductase [Planktomarina temperata]